MTRLRPLALLLTVLLSLAGASALAGESPASAELIARLEKRITLDQQVSGTFQQKKFLTVLPQPLHSNGRFSYDQRDGLVWETLAPIPNRLVFDRQGIRQSMDGKTIWEVEAQQPAVVTITRVISSVLAADWQTLQTYFDLSGTVGEAGWELSLVPRDDVLKQMVDSIRIRGDRVLASMVLMEANGDRTEIRFTVDSVPS